MRWRSKNCWASMRRCGRKYIRVLFAEITRILNHLLNITTFALDVGAITPLLWGFEEREKLMEFYERVSGARCMPPISAPAACIRICLPGLDRGYLWLHSSSFPKSRRLEHLLTENRILKQRTVDIGIVTRGAGARLGLYRPDAARLRRAWDLRKAQPYDIYDQMDFDIPIGKNGDC